MRPRAAAIMATILRMLIAIILLQQCWTCKGCVFFKGFHMTPGSKPWRSCNGLFGFGFLPDKYSCKYYLAIWSEISPGARNTMWIASSGSKVATVSQNATLRFDDSGNLQLTDGDGETVWQTNTTTSRAAFGKLSDRGNLVIRVEREVAPWPWESFSHPTVSLQANQYLTEKAALDNLPDALGNNHRLSFVRSGCTVCLVLTYVRAKASDFTYWRGPTLKNCCGGSASAFLTTGGSFAMTCGGAAGKLTYVFRSRLNAETPGQKETRQLKLDDDGRLVLSRFNTSSRLWVTEWATGSTPCAAAGACSNGICSRRAGQRKPRCSYPPGYSRTADSDCRRNVTAGLGCLAGEGYVMAKMEKAHYVIEGSGISKHCNVTRGECGELCIADCRCVASVYAPAAGGKAFCCKTLRAPLEFGGFPDPSAELYVKLKRPGLARHPLGSQSLDQFKEGEDNVSATEWLWLVIAVTFPALMTVCLPLYYLVKQGGEVIEEKDEGGEGSITTVPGMPVSFSFAELHEATSGFSERIARGGFSYIYKGRLPDGTEVAVKQLDEGLSRGQGRQRNFEAEVFTIGAMNHSNLVRLHGFCSEAEHRLLVYEYMENGSLDKWLFAREDDKAKRLSWKKRFDIAMATAKGIAYCHEQCRNVIIHCDIKPGNVLLDGNFQAKLSDFGLAKIVAAGEEKQTASVRGTRGYLAPEWWKKHRPVTMKVDVYSFGILLLDIVGGRRARNLSSDTDDFYYPIWAYEQMNNGTPEATVDSRLEGNVDGEELRRCLLVAFRCLQENPDSRPTMGKVVKMLEGLVPIDTPEVPKSFLYSMIPDGELSTSIHEPYHPTPVTVNISAF